MGKKLTHEEYVQQVKELGNGITVVGTYVNNSTKITHRCPEAHEWDVRPNDIKSGKGCPHCSGLIPQDYNEWLKDNRPDIVALEDYIGCMRKITHQCSEGHTWDVTPHDVKQGNGCPYCSGRIPQDYNDWLKENRPDIVALEDYRTAQTKIKHRCGEGHVWSVKPNSIKNGTGCPYCSGKIPQDYNEWLEQDGTGIVALEPYAGRKTRIVHRCARGHRWSTPPDSIKSGKGCPDCNLEERTWTSDQYNTWLEEDGRGIVALEPYVKSRTKIKHRCSNNHEWDVEPNRLRNGGGCPHCYHERLTHTADEYNEWLKEDGRGIVALQDYIHSNTKILHRCSEGHEWSTAPSTVKRDKGCPECATVKSDNNVLYIWQVIKSDVLTDTYKVGITSAKRGDQRIVSCASKHDVDYKLVCYTVLPEGVPATSIETQLLKLGRPQFLILEGDGHTEFRRFTPQEIDLVVTLLSAIEVQQKTLAAIAV